MISNNIKKRTYTSIFLLFLVYLIISYKVILVYTLILLGTLSVIEFFGLIKKIFKSKVFIFSINFLFSIYILIFCTIFSYLLDFLYLKIIIFTLLIGCISSDIGGYIIGKLFKGPKLTKISPKKTVVGAFGSVFFTCFFILSSIYYFTNKLSIQFLAIAIITSISCQLGDLFFSLLKRKAKIKDTGSFLPGHGGILDRIDGILLGLPMGLISILFIAQ